MTKTETSTAEARARKRAKYLSGLLWHGGAFLILNVFFWALDLVGASGIQWAFWITAAWGLALAFHALAYLIDGRNLEASKAQKYLDEERRRAAQPS